MNEAEYKLLVAKQREFFNSGKTLDYKFRISILQELKKIIINNESRIFEALNKDLGKPVFESYASEIGVVLQEINLVLRNLKKWIRPTHVYTPLVHFIARSYYVYKPYGIVLIISPWNYPYQLLFNPLIGAIAAGNCVIAKPSQHASNTSELMIDLINNNFKSEYLYILQGGSEINRIILKEKYNYIFFTGSAETAKQVMKAASENLTPLSLELGGKCPVIVNNDTNLKIAAKRIIWGKILNAGQSCVAPDYILVHSSVKEELVNEMKSSLEKFYGEDPSDSKDLCRIINRSNLERLSNYLKDVKILYGGKINSETLYCSPSLIEGVSPDHPAVKEEIFGPILPIIEFKELDEAIGYVSSRPSPLALYIFSNSSETRNKILRKTQSGGVCINETVVHFVNPYLPLGGIGLSGMGKYHGRFSFETFGYKRAVMHKSNLIDVPVRYPPYRNKTKFLRYFIK